MPVAPVVILPGGSKAKPYAGRRNVAPPVPRVVRAVAIGIGVDHPAELRQVTLAFPLPRGASALVGRLPETMTAFALGQHRHPRQPGLLRALIPVLCRQTTRADRVPSAGQTTNGSSRPPLRTLLQEVRRRVHLASLRSAANQLGETPACRRVFSSLETDA